MQLDQAPYFVPFSIAHWLEPFLNVYEARLEKVGFDVCVHSSHIYNCWCSNAVVEFP